MEENLDNNNEEEQPEKKKSGKKLVIGIIIGIIVVIGIIVISNNSNNVNQNCRKMQVPYEEIEHYTEREPYTDKVCENVELKYVDGYEWDKINEVCLNEICDEHEQYCVEWNWLETDCKKYEERCVNYVCTKYKKYCFVKIENIDDEDGTWNIGGYFWDRDFNRKGDFIETLRVYVRPTKYNTAEWSFTYDAGEDKSCWYLISNVPTKQVCDNIIKYRDVPRTRNITKYRTETVCD